MPRKHKEPKEPSDPAAHAFVLAVKAKLKATNGREFAHALGFYKADEERKAGKWVSGENAPNFHMTVKLLEAAGWLKPAGLRAYEQAVKDASLRPQVEADAAAAARRSKDLQERRRQTGGK